MTKKKVIPHSTAFLQNDFTSYSIVQSIFLFMGIFQTKNWRYYGSRMQMKTEKGKTKQNQAKQAKRVSFNPLYLSGTLPSKFKMVEEFTVCQQIIPISLPVFKILSNI